MAEKQSFKVFGDTFVVDTRYQLIRPVGKGSFGFVAGCKDTETGELVAIKKIPNAFAEGHDIKRLLRELRLLRHFKHENVLGLKTILSPPLNAPYNDIYIVTDLMDTDLYEIINSPQPLSDEHFQYFLFQILRGLKFLHAGSVLHRDMKPSNLLVNENCDLKICDFGLARFTDSEDNGGAGPMTQYVVTRWYRAPELLLSSHDYTQSVDMWSVGCILAELLGRKALFQGKDYFHQLCLIIDVLGSPTEAEISVIGNANTRELLMQLPKKSAVPWKVLFPSANPQALDLLSHLLCFDATKRYTVEEALKHPYLSALYDPRDEAISAVPGTFLASFEHVEAKEDLTDLVIEEIVRFNPNVVRTTGRTFALKDPPPAQQQQQ